MGHATVSKSPLTTCTADTSRQRPALVARVAPRDWDGTPPGIYRPSLPLASRASLRGREAHHPHPPFSMLEGSLEPPRSPFHARELQARIDAALERVPATWGVLVHSTTLGDLAIREPDAALVPASCVKLFTAMAALHARDVGPRRTLDTTARVVPDAAGPGWSTATLAVRPSGDPTLTGDALDALVARAALSSRVPIERIVAASLEGDEWCDEGAPGTWEVGDLRHAWAAPPSRACVDGNAECCAASPATFSRANPALAPKRLRQTRRGGAREGEGYECSYRHRADALEEPSDERSRRRVERAFVVAGGRRRRVAAKRASSPIVVHRSPPVSRLARLALEDSDNLVAEQLLRFCAHAAAERDAARWLTRWTSTFVRPYCPRSSEAPRRVRLADGSGLSRRNLAPPRALAAVVLAALSGRAAEAAAAAEETAEANRDGGEMDAEEDEAAEDRENFRRRPFAAFRRARRRRADGDPRGARAAHRGGGERGGARRGRGGSRVRGGSRRFAAVVDSRQVGVDVRRRIADRVLRTPPGPRARRRRLRRRRKQPHRERERGRGRGRRRRRAGRAVPERRRGRSRRARRAREDENGGRKRGTVGRRRGRGRTSREYPTLARSRDYGARRGPPVLPSPSLFTATPRTRVRLRPRPGRETLARGVRFVSPRGPRTPP